MASEGELPPCRPLGQITIINCYPPTEVFYFYKYVPILTEVEDFPSQISLI